MKDASIFDGTAWQSLKGPRGPNCYVQSDEPTGGGVGELWVDTEGTTAPIDFSVSADAGNELTNGSDGRAYSTAPPDSDAYVWCKHGEDVQSRYNAATALRPNGQPLSATNRATLLILPGSYPGTLTSNADYVDVFSVGQQPSSPSVSLAGITVTASHARISGIRVSGKFVTPNAPDIEVANCVGGDGSFGGGALSDAGVGAAGRFTNCIGGNYSFGGRATASGFFHNCVGGEFSFGTYFGTTGTFITCTGGQRAFGYSAATAGRFSGCTGGAESFGGAGNASGDFEDCVGGNFSFGGAGGSATGVFTNCKGGDSSFGRVVASGVFINCTGGRLAFCGAGRATGRFTSCVGGDLAFSGYSEAGGVFTGCVGGAESFGGGGGIANGSFTNCTSGNDSFHRARGSFFNCSGGTNSFGGDVLTGGLPNEASGFFDNCIGGAGSFRPLAGSARLVSCRLKSGAFAPAAGTILRFCLDGNYAEVNTP